MTCCEPLFSRRTKWLSTDQVPSGMLPMASPNNGNDASDALCSAPRLKPWPLVAHLCMGPGSLKQVDKVLQAQHCSK